MRCRRKTADIFTVQQADCRVIYHGKYRSQPTSVHREILSHTEWENAPAAYSLPKLSEIKMLKNTNKYDDIISLPHHVSKKRAPMPQRDRAAQFSPFAALTGYDAEINEAARLTDGRLNLSEDAKARLDERLQVLADKIDEKPAVKITYFVADKKKDGGAYLTFSGSVRRIDEYEPSVIFTDGTKIPFKDIAAVEGEIFRFLDNAL